MRGNEGIWALCFLLGVHVLQAQILENILVYGQKNTDPEVILRELKIQPGSRINETLLRRERDWLLRLDFLKRIDFLTKSGSRPDRKILMIVIRERTPWSFSPSLDMDNLFGISLGGCLTCYNLRGNRERIRISAMAGGFRQVRFSWHNPWMAGPLHLFAEMGVEYKNFEYLYRDWNDPFRQTGWSAQSILGRQWGRRIRTGILLGVERIRVSDPAVALSAGHEDNLLKTGAFVLYDTRDWPFYPRTGMYWRSGLDLYRLPAEKMLRFYSTDFRTYFPMGTQQILAFQIAGHLSEGNTPVYKRTHFGGSRTVRGYATGKQAGENIVYTSLEYRFPWLYERNPSAGLHFGINGVLFLDTGSVWWNSEPFNWNSVRGSAGFGVHLIWDQWVIRAEYGAHGRGWGFISTGTDVKF